MCCVFAGVGDVVCIVVVGDVVGVSAAGVVVAGCGVVVVGAGSVVYADVGGAAIVRSVWVVVVHSQRCVCVVYVCFYIACIISGCVYAVRWRCL